MKKLSVNQKIRLPFIIISTLFVVSGLLGLFLLVKVQYSYDYYSNNLIRLEKIYRSILTTDRLVQGLRNEEDSRESKEFLSDLSVEGQNLKSHLLYLQQREVDTWWAKKSFKELLYSPKWNFFINFQHFQKIQNELIKDLKVYGHIERTKLFEEIEGQTTRILDVSNVLGHSLERGKEKLELLRKKILIGMTTIFSMILALVFLFVYRPWKREYQYLEDERERLQGVLKESEIRGNTFSWEVNFETKLTRRSNHLSGLFEFEGGATVVSLEEELALFGLDSQKKFETALENCALKGEIFDVQVELTTKNKKRYWLHYYAKKKLVSGEILIVGTVRDITHQKLAEERFRVLFEQLKLPALIFSEGEIKEVNDAALRFFNITESRDYDNLHPAILFPLYQLDGHSSLERLKSTLATVRAGNSVDEDWLFKLSKGREVAGVATLFNIPFPTADMHIMLIHDDSKKFEFERRLVDTNRKALHARRVKLEYVTQMGIILDELIDLVDEEVKQREVSELGHPDKLTQIKKQLEFLWGENISQGLVEESNTILTDFTIMLEGLEKRWRRSARKMSSSLTIKSEDKIDQYLWVDSVKLKLALNNLVYAAIHFKENSEVDIVMRASFSGNRYGKISFTVRTDAQDWIQSDWTLLSPLESEDKKDNKSIDFIKLVELLQGEVFFDEYHGKVGIGFSCNIERVIGVSADQLNQVSESPLRNEKKISASEVWSYFGGDWDIIENTIKDFFDYYPRAISDLYSFLEQKNSEKLVEVSTDLYGVITHFPFFSAIESIVKIQKYSKYLHFDKVEVELNHLSSELNSFHHALEDFLPQGRKKSA